MRIQYLSQDRCDLADASKCLAQRMKDPTVHDAVKIKRVATYLLNKPVVFYVFVVALRAHNTKIVNPKG